MLKVEKRRSDGALVVTVGGDVDSSTAAVLRTALAAVQDEDVVIVDLRAVPFMDSAGLGAVIGGIRRFRSSGSATGLCTRRGAVQRLLNVTGFDRIVPCFRSVDEACASLLTRADPAEAASA